MTSTTIDGHRYTLHSYGDTSHAEGPCDVCGTEVDDMHWQVDVRLAAPGQHWRALWGHEECLRGARRGGESNGT